MSQSIMHRTLLVTRVLLVAVLAMLASAVGAIEPAKAQTLKAVKERGALVCGVNEGLLGFSAKDAKGEWSGFDVEFCRALAGRARRALELTQASVPQPLACRLADLPLLGAATDAVLVADRTGRPVEDVAATYFVAGAFFQIDRLSAAARQIAISDYFDRLALDRALDSIGDAARRITAQMMSAGAVGETAVQDWLKARGHEVDRVRRATHEILGSDLTLSRLTVAASMLGELFSETREGSRGPSSSADPGVLERFPIPS
jgi:hypothetical protein